MSPSADVTYKEAREDEKTLVKNELKELQQNCHGHYKFYTGLSPDQMPITRQGLVCEQSRYPQLGGYFMILHDSEPFWVNVKVTETFIDHYKEGNGYYTSYKYLYPSRFVTDNAADHGAILTPGEPVWTNPLQEHHNRRNPSCPWNGSYNKAKSIPEEKRKSRRRCGHPDWKSNRLVSHLHTEFDRCSGNLTESGQRDLTNRVGTVEKNPGPETPKEMVLALEDYLKNIDENSEDFDDTASALRIVSEFAQDLTQEALVFALMSVAKDAVREDMTDEILLP